MKANSTYLRRLRDKDFVDRVERKDSIRIPYDGEELIIKTIINEQKKGNRSRINS